MKIGLLFENHRIRACRDLIGAFFIAYWGLREREGEKKCKPQGQFFIIIRKLIFVCVRNAFNGFSLSFDLSHSNRELTERFDFVCI